MNIQLTLLLICIILLIVSDIYVISKVAKEIEEKEDFYYFDRNTWLMIIIWGSLIGQLLYFILERNRNDHFS